MTEAYYKEVYFMLRKTSQFLKDHLRKQIEEHGITWQQFHALYHIADEGIQFNELAKHLGCNASNMTGLIDRMSENGWVYREHAQHDRRVWLVKLTKDGIKLKDELLPKHRANIALAMGVLDDEEIIVFSQLLTKLMNNNMED